MRLRVEHTGFARLNVSKFGQRFVGKVANPDELLLFYKQKLTTVRGSRTGGVRASDLDLSSLHAKRDVDEAPPISSIVAQLIARSPLSVLSEAGLASAIADFVDKKSVDSIQDFVRQDLRSVQADVKGEREVMGKGAGLSAEEIEKQVKKRQEEQRGKEGVGKRRGLKAKTEGGKGKGGRGDGGEGEEERDVLEGLDEGQLNLLGINRVGGTDDEAYEEGKEEKKKGRGSKGGGSRATTAAGRGRGRGGGRATASRRAKAEPEPEEEEATRDDDAERDGGHRRRGGGDFGGEDDFDEDEGENDWGPPVRPSPARAKADAGRSQVTQEEAEDDEATLDDEDVPVSKRSRVKAEPLALGSRNRAGELSFLTGRGAGGGARGKKPAQSSSSSSSAAPRGRGAASHVVDLSEDVED